MGKDKQAREHTQHTALSPHMHSAHLARQQGQGLQRGDGVPLAAQHPRHLAPHRVVGGALHGAVDAATALLLLLLLQQHLQQQRRQACGVAVEWEGIAKGS